MIPGGLPPSDFAWSTAFGLTVDPSREGLCRTIRSRIAHAGRGPDQRRRRPWTSIALRAVTPPESVTPHFAVRRAGNVPVPLSGRQVGAARAGADPGDGLGGIDGAALERSVRTGRVESGAVGAKARAPISSPWTRSWARTNAGGQAHGAVGGDEEPSLGADGQPLVQVVEVPGQVRAISLISCSTWESLLIALTGRPTTKRTGWS